MEKDTEKAKNENQQAQTDEAVEMKEAKPKKKRINRTWEAFGRSKGCFIINDPQFML